MLTKHSINKNKLNKVFRFINYIIVILFILPFIFECYITFYHNYFNISFLHNLWIMFQYHISFKYYILNTDTGLLYDLELLLPIILLHLPLLIISVLFFLINKFNKKYEKITKENK